MADDGLLITTLAHEAALPPAERTIPNPAALAITRTTVYEFEGRLQADETLALKAAGMKEVEITVPAGSQFTSPRLRFLFDMRVTLAKSVALVYGSDEAGWETITLAAGSVIVHDYNRVATIIPTTEIEIGQRIFYAGEEIDLYSDRLPSSREWERRHPRR